MLNAIVIQINFKSRCIIASRVCGGLPSPIEMRASMRMRPSAQRLLGACIILCLLADHVYSTTPKAKKGGMHAPQREAASSSPQALIDCLAVARTQAPDEAFLKVRQSH